MGAVLLSPLYILLNIYLISRMLLWFSTLQSVLGSLWFVVPFLILYTVIALSPLIAAFGKGKIKITARVVNNYWMGTLMYLLLFLLLADLGRVIVCLVKRQSPFSVMNLDTYRLAGGIVFGLVVLFSVYGILHAAHVKKTHYDVSVQKNCSLPSLKIALVADLHLGGSIGLPHAQKMKHLIQEMEPDLIIYAGDIFDNDFDAITDPEAIADTLGGLHSTYGSFACWGNHDIDEVILAGFTFDSGKDTISSDPRMDHFLKEANIRLLKDETILVEQAFYLSGRLDASCRQKSGISRLSCASLLSSLDHRKPLLVIDHQPSELEELAAAGADLILSGHTHDGQLFPGNLTTRIGWKNSCGKLCIGNMTSIVTSGIGIWGPAMRIGTDSEVVELFVEFSGEETD